MKKVPESKRYTQVKQFKLILEIQNNENFLDFMLDCVKNEKHLIHKLLHFQLIQRLQKFMKNHLQSEIKIMEDWFNKSSESFVTEKMYNQSNQRLQKLLQILKYLYENENFQKDQDKNTLLYLKILSLSDNFKVLEKLLSLLIKCMFQKIGSQFYQQVYFFINHIDIFNQKNTQIKELYNLGTKIKKFQFFFIDESTKNQQQIVLEDFYMFIVQKDIKHLNYIQLTDYILKEFKIQMLQNSMAYRALKTKIKIYRHSVLIGKQNEIINEADIIVRCVVNSNVIYGLIQLFVLGQQFTQINIVPNIFTLPPDYSQIIKQCLEIYLEPKSSKQTHLAIIKDLNQLLESQQKNSTIDIIGKFNQNSNLIFKFLVFIKAVLRKEQITALSHLFNKQTIEDMKFMEEILIILKLQITSISQLNTIAEGIAQAIFTKKSSFQYSDKIIVQAGSILVYIEYQQEKLMKIILEKIQTDIQNSKPYLKVLNDIFSKKNSRHNQRRDLGYIARQSSESIILQKMMPLIQEETKTKVVRESFLMNTILLISNICQQSPTLLQNIKKTKAQIIPYLLKIITQGHSFPEDNQSINDIINFLHHISLIDGPIRNQMLRIPLQSFICTILSDDRFIDAINQYKNSFIVGNINRIITNIKCSSKYIFHGIIKATKMLCDQYKLSNLQGNLLEYLSKKQKYIQIKESMIWKLYTCDCKLSNILRIVLKTSQLILKKFDSVSLITYATILVKLQMSRSSMFLDLPYQNTLLSYIIKFVLNLVKEFNSKMKQKEDRLKQLRQLPNQNYMEQQQHDFAHRPRTPMRGEQISSGQQNVNAQLHQAQNNASRVEPRQIRNIVQLCVNFSQQAHEKIDIQEQLKQDHEEGVNPMMSKSFDTTKLSWHHTVQKYNQLTSVWDKIKKRIFQTVDTLQRIITQNSLRFESQKQIKQISQISISSIMEKIIIKNYSQQKQKNQNEKMQQKGELFEVEIILLIMNATKLQRYLSYIYKIVNFQAKNIDQQFYVKIAQKCSKTFLQLIKLSVSSHALAIEQFLKIPKKFQQSNRFPSFRTDSKQVEYQAISKHMKMVDLNQKWGIYHSLLGVMCKFATIGFFVNVPNYIALFTQKFLYPTQNYFLKQIIPKISNQMNFEQLQGSRQLVHIISELFCVHDSKDFKVLKIPQIQKVPMNKIIGIYCYFQEDEEQNIYTVLSEYIKRVDAINLEGQDLRGNDTQQMRIKCVKKIFYKSCLTKIKQFLQQTFNEDIELKNPSINEFQKKLDQVHHKKHQQQVFYLYSKIYKKFCSFFKGASNNSSPQAYSNQVLAINSALISHFSNVIMNNQFDLIYFNSNLQIEDQAFSKKSFPEMQNLQKQIIRQTENLDKWLTTKSQLKLRFIPMIKRAVLNVHQPSNELEDANFKTPISVNIKNISQKINSISYKLFQKQMNLGISGISKPRIDQNEQIILANQIQCFSNLLAQILQMIKFVNQKQWFSCGNPSISTNYVKAVLTTAILILQTFEVNQHAPAESDKLVLTILHFMQTFVTYKKSKQIYLQTQKKNRRKQIKKQKKKHYKSAKLNQKLAQKQNQSSYIQPQSSEFNKRPLSRHSKRPKQKKQNTLKHDKSKTSLLISKVQQDNHKKVNKKIKVKNQNHQFNKKCTEFFKIIYLTSQNNPFLSSATLQFSICFLQKFSKDVIVKNQIDEKIQFYINSEQIFSSLLKVKVTCPQFKGFFYQLAHLSMALMTEKHIKIDIQAAIKRFFYESNSKRVRLSIFSVFLKENFIKMPNLHYLLNLIYINKDKSSKKKQKQDQKDQMVQIHQFTTKNINRLCREQDDRVLVELKNSDQYGIISLPLNKKKKNSQNNNEEETIKKVRFFQYHPQGDLSALLCQIISHLIKIAIKQIVKNDQKSKQMQEQQSKSSKASIFSLKTLLYTLQVIIRQSPILSPWIARFKCKKIIIKELKKLGLNINNQVYKLILLMIYTQNQFTQQNQIPQISLISLLVQFIFPLSQISTFVFQLCLDNNVLTHIHQKSKQKQGEIQKRTVTFGSVVRKKVLQQIQQWFTKIQTREKKVVQNKPNQNYMILKKISIMGLLTVLFSIKQFAKLCIQSNLILKIQNEYERTNNIILELLEKKYSNIPVSSSLMRNFVLPFFLKPLEIIQQLSVSYQINKRKGKKAFVSKPNIKVILTSQSINEQILEKDVFSKNRFKILWPYLNILDGEDLLEQQFQQMSDLNQQSNSSDQEQDQLRFLDNVQADDIDLQNSSENIHENIQQLAELNQLVDQERFQRDSNTFQNQILGYPEGDDFINQDSQEQDSQVIDSYDDSQAESYQDSNLQQDSQIQQQIEQQSEGNINLQSNAFPLDLNSYLDNKQFFQNQNLARILPVGIFQFYSPSAPTKRQHQGHSFCPKSVNREIQKTQNLYQAFMDIVAFENITITNQMVKLQNQQAKLIRKIFKIIAYKKLPHQLKIKKHSIQQDICYFQQILKIIECDVMFKWAEHIDFQQCERGLYSIQSIPQHFYNWFQNNSENIFNLKPKLIRDKRRNGMFLNLADLSGLRRPGIIPQRFDNPPILIRQQPVQNNDQNQNDPNEPFESENQIQEISEQRSQQPMARLQFNINLPNMNINLNADFSLILRNLGMTQAQFRNLPQQVQSDIIRNSLMQGGQLQNVFDQVINRNQENLNINQGLNPPPGSLANQQSRSQMQNQVLSQNRSQAEMQNRQNMRNNQDNNENNHQMQQEIDQNISNQQINSSQNQQDDQLPEQGRKKQDSQKIKDVIQLLNKDGKNNHKFIAPSDHLLQLIFEQLFIVEEKDFSRFTFGLLQSYMINSNSCQKILSSLIVILNLYLSQSSQDSQSLIIEDNSKMPKNQLRLHFSEIIKNFNHKVYPILAMKCLTILQVLTMAYSISQKTLQVSKEPINCLLPYFNRYKNNNSISAMESIIRLLKCQVINNSSVLLTKVLNILNNIIEPFVDKQVKIQNETYKKIQLQSESVQILCNLLQADELKDSSLLSKNIIRFSINRKNLFNFIKQIEKVLNLLVQKSIKYLKKNLDYHLQNIEEQEQIKGEINDLNKVYSLVYIFYEMIKEFKTHSSKYFPDKQQQILNEFKRIVSTASIYKLCEIICDLILNKSLKVTQLLDQVPEFLQCFFIFYSIAVQFASKGEQKQKQKEINKIASLGQINKQNQQKLKNNKKEVVMLGEYNLSILWEQKICSNSGRIYLNSCIKKKLISFIKRKKQKKISFFEVPMIKIVLNTSHLLDFQNKRALFRAQLKRLKYKKNYPGIFMSLNRQQVFQQSFNQIMGRKGEELKGKLKIDFLGQEGQDAGGLTREWFQLLSTQMFNPNYGLFKPSSTGNTYQPSSMSYVNTQHLQYFKFIGRIMGKALHDGYMLDAYFTPAFYKHILNLPITYLDMEEEDYEYFKSLKWILEVSPIQDYNLGFTFTYQFDNFGETQIKQLIPNGADIEVTEENKLQYVQLICYAKMATAVKMQLQNFLQGLHQLIPHRLLKIFDAKQLQIMISGLPTIDITDLKRNTDLVNYGKTDQIIIWLFQVLQSFDMSLRTSFLQFVTGTSRVPPEGFKALNGFNGPQKFNIHKQFNVQFLPRAHTCFNQLDLPNYASKQILIQKLTYAITQGKQGFGFM